MYTNEHIVKIAEDPVIAVFHTMKIYKTMIRRQQQQKYVNIADAATAQI